MKIVLAPDSYKNSLTAKQVAQSMKKGFAKVYPDAEFVNVPMADGGEGTVQSLVDARNGQMITETVVNPLGNKTQAQYGLIDDGQVAIIEMAQASGIQFINQFTQNPYVTTTFGTGELIKSAIQKGAKTIIIGIGGSATNDGGAGMAQALGAKLLDDKDKELQYGGAMLKKLDHIDISQMLPELKDVKVIIASDVTNPLTGKNGASHVFGPQKGASPEMVDFLDEALSHYADVLKRDLGKDLEQTPGAGAAGGLGAGLLAFTNSQMRSGVDIVVDYTGLKDIVQDADVVITGEGQIDFQTKFGKTPIGVAKATKAVNPNATVIAIAGSVGEKISELYPLGIDAIFTCVPGVEDLSKAIADTDKNLQQVSENIARLIKNTK
ncbi:glycerate kinase [Companilactobacillus pabuli]|jgi:glycerate kinase|uniref:Glycerate kinase n=1 Tax=Companilactobacillus pabuli TaxID=2714036 RepID=A0A7L7KX39_9LACO|nr:glycerate kinase [Companilactobacillus pabuli]AKP04022.1 glycerate kinase [Companilactobacillus farciminis]AKS52327.1 glycerate kinase [Companilactobacillus farciminis]MDG5113285.1 glycerate kinase [Companilactobacillus pabuli]QMT83912.1 glycerate kinase [Companilactobacillus pabuli]GAQ00387.1 glycerate kinase [Companilactobacillus farciminis]